YGRHPNGEGEGGALGVCPALIHFFCGGIKRSGFGACNTSTGRMVPAGMRGEPSSALESDLPGARPCVPFMVFGSRTATFLTSLLPTKYSPLGSTTDGESPMNAHFGGGCTGVQVLATGS